MKVTDVKVEAYRWPRKVPIRNGLHTYSEYDLNVVKIETDEESLGSELVEILGKRRLLVLQW